MPGHRPAEERLMLKKYWRVQWYNGGGPTLHEFESLALAKTYAETALRGTFRPCRDGGESEGLVILEAVGFMAIERPTPPVKFHKL
jgi:hypothetical protein